MPTDSHGMLTFALYGDKRTIDEVDLRLIGQVTVGSKIQCALVVNPNLPLDINDLDPTSLKPGVEEIGIFGIRNLTLVDPEATQIDRMPRFLV